MCARAAEYPRVLLKDRSYMLFGEAADFKTFEPARLHCIARGGQLASTVDASEAQTLATEMYKIQAAANAKAAWIGLARVNYTSADANTSPFPTSRQTTDKALWAWLTTNKVPQYDGWRIKNQNNQYPNNQAGKEGICADMILSTDSLLSGRWDDENCATSLPFACESVGESVCTDSQATVGGRVP